MLPRKDSPKLTSGINRCIRSRKPVPVPTEVLAFAKVKSLAVPEVANSLKINFAGSINYELAQMACKQKIFPMTAIQAEHHQLDIAASLHPHPNLA